MPVLTPWWVDSAAGLAARNTVQRPVEKEWATCENLSTGIVNTMDEEEEPSFQPGKDEVQGYLCGLLKDLAKYDLDGIVLDRGRFGGIQSISPT